MNRTRKIRVVIADDHDIYRDGLQLLLSKDPSISVIGEAVNGQSLLTLLGQLEADVALIDIRMPVLDGISAISNVARQYPAVRTVALSMYNTEQTILNALEAGALGYIIKNAQKGEIIEGVKAVYRRQPYYCEFTSQLLIRMVAGSDLNRNRNKQQILLSPKDKEIIRLICEERSSREIAGALSMNIRTVEGQRVKLMEKMNVKTAVGVAIYAYSHDLYPDSWETNIVGESGDK
jgi:DNA-binding NarL/FixJ family response regulator